MQHVASLPMIVRQHFEDAAFLFDQRRATVSSRTLSEIDLGRRDQRIAANVAGLIAAGQSGWDIAQQAANEFPGAGETFALGVLAFGHGEGVGQALDLALQSADAQAGFSGALAWSAAADVGPFVRGWLASGEASLRCLGLASLSHHRRDPGVELGQFLNDPAADVRARAARLAFELGRADVLPALGEVAAANPSELWVQAAVARFGPSSDGLYSYLARGLGPKTEFALDLCLTLAPALAKARVTELMRAELTRNLGLSRAGLLADTSIARWLVSEMAIADRAEAAGYALLDLFSIDPADSGLFSSDPAILGAGFEGDGATSYPVADRITAWLSNGATGANFTSLRSRMINVLRDAARNRTVQVADWRATRRFAAWI